MPKMPVSAVSAAPSMEFPRPLATVDVVIFGLGEQGLQVLLVQRPGGEAEPFPHAWALPGGFVDYGETVEAAAVREALEETGLRVTLHALIGVYSDPTRDPRLHTITTVFQAKAKDYSTLAGGDDARDARFFPLDKLPGNIMFGHDEIIADFISRFVNRPLG